MVASNSEARQALVEGLDHLVGVKNAKLLGIANVAHELLLFGGRYLAIGVSNHGRACNNGLQEFLGSEFLQFQFHGLRDIEDSVPRDLIWTF